MNEYEYENKIKWDVSLRIFRNVQMQDWNLTEVGICLFPSSCLTGIKDCLLVHFYHHVLPRAWSSVLVMYL